MDLKNENMERPQPQMEPQIPEPLEPLQMEPMEPIEMEPPQMQRQPLMADAPVLENVDATNFEYIAKKVAVLQEQVELMQKILHQNNLSYKMEVRANSSIEDKTWELIGEEE